MKKVSLGAAVISAMVLMAVGVFGAVNTYADEEDNKASESKSSEEGRPNGTSISLTPVSKVLQISSNSTYKDTMTITNDSDIDMDIEVYAAPYSYVYSEVEKIYKLGFNNDNDFTQIVRWITFDNGSGKWVDKANYKVPANGKLDVPYMISTPSDIPAGGQYAVIFAHTLTSVVSANGIRTEASPGMVIYGRSTEGETNLEAEISDMDIMFGVDENGVKRDNFFAKAMIKNSGNIDFSAEGILKVDSIIGGGGYETPANKGRISVIPETTLELNDEWENSPGFGIYKVTWTVTAAGETQTIEEIVFVNPLAFIILTIILLTTIIVAIIIVVRKRKERSSRLAV